MTQLYKPPICNSGSHWESRLFTDHEKASNAGNWQWLSCTAFFSQFFRVYSPVAFPQKWDKEGLFVRRYVPELEDMPVKYIYEPWKAPLQDQRKAGVRIAGDGKAIEEGVYPKPMFDFAERRAICLEAMKKAYSVGLYGDDPRVIDGAWRTLFPDSAEGPTEGASFPDAMIGSGSGSANGSKNGEAKVQRRRDAREKNDGAVPEEGAEAAQTGGENKGGDIAKGSKRKGAQGMLDKYVVKRTKK
jgi:cryptochrome